MKMNRYPIFLILSALVFTWLLTSCSPSREDSGLLPTFYVSQTAQKRVCTTLLARTWEQIRLVDQLQKGFACPNPQESSSGLLPADHDYYARSIGDSLVESVRFVPNIWQNPGTHADSVYYGWNIYGGDTTNNGTYYYLIASKRVTQDSLSHLTGSAVYHQNYVATASDGYTYDYSYSIIGSFDVPGGAPPPLGDAVYSWSGTVLTWESDAIPSRWDLTGTSRRTNSGGWSITMAIDNDELLRAELDSLGIGSYRIGWNDFDEAYNYRP